MQSEPFCSELGCGGGIAGPELDPDGLEGGEIGEQDSPAALRQLRTRLGDDRPCLVEATDHRQRSGPVCTEEVVAPVSWLVLIEPGEQL